MPVSARRFIDQNRAGLLDGFVQMTTLPHPGIPGWNSAGTIAPV